MYVTLNVSMKMENNFHHFFFEIRDMKHYMFMEPGTEGNIYFFSRLKGKTNALLHTQFLYCLFIMLQTYFMLLDEDTLK